VAEPDGPIVAYPPARGLWRVGRADDPLRPSRLDPGDVGLANAGNRYDVVEFGVVYLATELEGCFAETLARFRPSTAVLAELRRDKEWERRGFMPPSSVPADWRRRRLAVRVRVAEPVVFLDVDAPATHRFLEEQLASELNGLGVEQLDVASVRGGDRRVSRLVAEWTAGHLLDVGGRWVTLGGVCYVSRLGDWECWAVFSDVALAELERRAIFASTPELRRVARQFHLRVF